MSNLSGAFLSGNIMVDRVLPISWKEVLDYVTPLTTGALAEQFEEAQTQLNALLAATPSPSINVKEIVLPISLVNDLNNSFKIFGLQYGNLPWNLFQEATEEISSVFDDYSTAYYQSPPPPNGYFVY